MSWAGHIVSTSISNVNSEVGYSSTASTSFDDTRVRRLANRITGSSTIGMDNMRFGLQLPLISYTDGVNANTLYLAATDIGSGYSIAYAGIILSSNGAGQYYTYQETRFPQYIIEKSFTWLTSGSAGDYTAQYLKISGDSPSGPAVNTDHALSTTRDWQHGVFIFSPSTSGSSSGTATIQIKRSGVVGPYRKCEFFVYAEAF